MGSDAQEARREARRTIELAPDWSPGHALLGLLLMDEGRHADAERAFLGALNLDPENELAYLSYGTLMHKTGQLDKAEKLLRRRSRLDPEYSAAHSRLGSVMADRGRRAAAKERGQRGVALAPESASDHDTLGRTYLRTGHPFRARRHFRESLRLEPDEDTEEAFLEADHCCRVVYLPMYYYSLLIERLPGRQFALWILFLLWVFRRPETRRAPVRAHRGGAGLHRPVRLHLDRGPRRARLGRLLPPR